MAPPRNPINGIATAVADAVKEVTDPLAARLKHLEATFASFQKTHKDEIQTLTSKVDDLKGQVHAQKLTIEKQDVELIQQRANLGAKNSELAKTFKDITATNGQVAKALEEVHRLGGVVREFTSIPSALLNRLQSPVAASIEFQGEVIHEDDSDQNAPPPNLKGRGKTARFTTPVETQPHAHVPSSMPGKKALRRHQAHDSSSEIEVNDGGGMEGSDDVAMKDTIAEEVGAIVSESGEGGNGGLRVRTKAPPRSSATPLPQEMLATSDTIMPDAHTVTHHRTDVNPSQAPISAEDRRRWKPVWEIQGKSLRLSQEDFIRIKQQNDEDPLNQVAQMRLRGKQVDYNMPPPPPPRRRRRRRGQLAAPLNLDMPPPLLPKNKRNAGPVTREKPPAPVSKAGIASTTDHAEVPLSEQAVPVDLASDKDLEEAVGMEVHNPATNKRAHATSSQQVHGLDHRSDEEEGVEVLVARTNKSARTARTKQTRKMVPARDEHENSKAKSSVTHNPARPTRGNKVDYTAMYAVPELDSDEEPEPNAEEIERLRVLQQFMTKPTKNAKNSEGEKTVD